MATIRLNILGVNAFVPHGSKNKLMVVMPNATCLGQSPTATPSGHQGKSHIPFFWSRNGWDNRRSFAGQRLTFVDHGDEPHVPPAWNDDDLHDPKKNAWFEIDSSCISPTPDPERVSGQVVVDRGTLSRVSPPPADCARRLWSDTSLSVDPVVYEMRCYITMKGDVDVLADGKRLIPTLKSTQNHELFLGNVCAEDILDWPQPAPDSTAPGYDGLTVDDDIDWLFMLTSKAGWPQLKVDAKDLNSNKTPSEIYNALRGTGSGIGCECNSLVTKSAVFA